MNDLNKFCPPDPLTSTLNFDYADDKMQAQLISFLSDLEYDNPLGNSYKGNNTIKEDLLENNIDTSQRDDSKCFKKTDDAYTTSKDMKNLNIKKDDFDHFLSTSDKFKVRVNNCNSDLPSIPKENKLNYEKSQNKTISRLNQVGIRKDNIPCIIKKLHLRKRHYLLCFKILLL